MKHLAKILSVASALIILTSCVDYSQKNIDLGISLKDVPSNFGNYKKIQVKAFDERPVPIIIGTKKVGAVLVTIKSNQDLAALIAKRISEGMERKGFAVGDDKILEIHIITFEYKAQRQFFTGHSRADALFKIVVKDKYDNNKKYQKNYGLTVEKDHFIMPLITTDEDTINNVLQETVNDIFNDSGLIENLKS